MLGRYFLHGAVPKQERTVMIIFFSGFCALHAVMLTPQIIDFSFLRNLVKLNAKSRAKIGKKKRFLHLQPLSHVLDQIRRPLSVHQLLVGVHAALAAG